MDIMWETGCIPLLLTHLVNIAKDSGETSLRREFAALWIQQILSSLIKVSFFNYVESGICKLKQSGTDETFLAEQ